MLENEIVLDMSNSFDGNLDKYFDSSDENEEEDEEEPVSRKKGREYRELQRFGSNLEFEKSWEGEKKNWRIQWKGDLKSDYVEYYTCAYAKRIKPGFF